MTEAEWLSATDPTPMLEFLRGKASERKLRLFACATVRLLWTIIGEEPSAVVEVAEAYADGAASKGALRRGRFAVRDERERLETAEQEAGIRWQVLWLTETVATLRAYDSVVAEWTRFEPNAAEVHKPEWAITCAFIRDIFTGTIRPVIVDPAWLTSVVLDLARQMYDSRNFTSMPILADALQDAGCEDADILNHCRSEGLHVRGCWAVDLLLGKK